MKSIKYILLLFLTVNCNTTKDTLNTTHNTKAIKVLDTDFSKGRLTLEHKITLEDLEKFHGHLCDGLIQGFLGIQEGLKLLYPSGIIDRTNTRIISNSSPCLTDVAIYITGGRYQYNSFYVDDSIQDAFYILQRKDNNKTVKIKFKKGVKPLEIDELGAKAVKGELSPCDLDKLKNLEDKFSGKLLSSNPKIIFEITEISNFDWKPQLRNDYTKIDILNKNKSKCQ
tara:strand:- start:678 stop:1355 length:678 start_codon:yes stop_codon:yes gene_type:complete